MHPRRESSSRRDCTVIRFCQIYAAGQAILTDRLEGTEGIVSSPPEVKPLAGRKPQTRHRQSAHLAYVDSHKQQKGFLPPRHKGTEVLFVAQNFTALYMPTTSVGMAPNLTVADTTNRRDCYHQGTKARKFSSWLRAFVPLW